MNGRYDTTGNVESQFEPGGPHLDYTHWDNRKTDYFAAIQAGMSDHEPMRGLVRRVLREAVGNASG